MTKLEFHEVISNTLGLFDPYCFFVMLPFPYRVYLEPVTADSSDESILNHAVAFHESIHLLQSIGTLFGASIRWYWNAVATVMNEIYTYICEFYSSKPSVKIPFPLTSWLRHPSINAQLLAKELLGWSFIKVMAARLSPEFGNATLSDLELPGLETSSLIASPSIHFDSYRSVQLAGVYLLEAHARWLEEQYISGLMNNTRRSSSILGMLSQDERYTVARKYFEHNLPAERHNEFPFIVDLALNVPLVPEPRTESEWMASHPGYRFVQAIKGARKITPLKLVHATEIEGEEEIERAKEIARYMRDLAVASGLEDPATTTARSLSE